MSKLITYVCTGVHGSMIVEDKSCSKGLYAPWAKGEGWFRTSEGRMAIHTEVEKQMFGK